MDILLVISSREGIYLYLRNGKRIFVTTKMKNFFTADQLAWLLSYQKGARVNLIHLIVGAGAFLDSFWCKNTYHNFMEGCGKSLLELAHVLKITPVYLENIAQQILNREQMDRRVLSLNVFE